MSLALVETVPIYNAVTGIGTKNKKLLKAMTSSAIVFTIFVLGGSAYFILTWLDISSDEMLIKNSKKKKRTSILYPQMACGGRGDAEMELTTAPSWRNYPTSPVLTSPRPASPRFGISGTHPMDIDAALQTSTSYIMNRTQSELTSDSMGLNRCASMDNRLLSNNEPTMQPDVQSPDTASLSTVQPDVQSPDTASVSTTEIKTARSSPPQLV